MAIFGPAKPLRQDELDWQLAAFQWLLEEFEGVERHAGSTLFNPDGDYFADSALTGDQRAQELLLEIKQMMDIGDWPTRLVPMARIRAPEHITDTIILQPIGPSSAGTFQLVEDESMRTIAQIRYAPDQLADPPSLVATFAHELSHYLLTSRRHTFPGGDDLHELLTDLTAVFMGFGIFLVNSARNHVSYQNALGSGWSSHSQGYLSERALVTALAISERLAGRDPMAARPYLKKYLADDLAIVDRWLGKRDILSDVMAMNLADFGVVPLPSQV